MRKLLLLLVVAGCVGAGLAYGAVALTADEGSIVCVNEKQSGVNGRFVQSASDCRSNETVHELVGPAGSVAHADEADHAATADDADTLDGRDSTEFMSGYSRETGTFTSPPGSAVFWTSNCDPGKEAISFGVRVTNLGDLSPRPFVVSDGEIDLRNWQIIVQNQDPDTPMTTFAHNQCIDAVSEEAAPTAKSAKDAGGPLATVGG